MPDPGEKPPLLREHRLYQADWLLRFYGFRAEELLTEERPNFNVFLDPKCDWAVRHLEHFPVEIMRADYETLLRVPGIGVKSARRILTARRMGSLDFPDLKRLGVIERIVPEYGGADQSTVEAIGGYLKEHIKEFLQKYTGMTGEQIAEERYERFRKY